MNIIDTIKRHTVVVGKGSGVLVQAMTDEFSYIVTAKHNLQIDVGNSESELTQLENIEIKTFCGGVISANNIYPHPDEDAAIIEVDFIDDILIHPYLESSVLDDKLYLYGYPGTRRRRQVDVSDWIGSYRLTVNDYSDTYFTFRNADAAPVEDVRGFSGGGLFIIDEYRNKAWLAGIENAMENVQEAHERLKGIPIGIFNQCLQDFNKPEIRPLHLSCFTKLQDEVFSLDKQGVMPFDVAKFDAVISFLKIEVSKSAGSVTHTPLEILKNNLEKFIVNGRNASELENKEFWVSLLELIALDILCKDLEVVSLEWESYFNEFFKEYRVIYIETEKDWKDYFQNILTTNTDGLSDKGKIILLVGKGPLPHYQFSQEIIDTCIENISNVDGQGGIDNALRIQRHFPVIHLVSLHNHCIFSNVDIFSDINSISKQPENLSFLKQHYRPILCENGEEHG